MLIWIYHGASDDPAVECAITVLLQNKGADIWTHRSYKRLKSVKHCAGCTSYRVSANMRNASLEAQIWTCQHANVAVEAPPSILLFIFIFIFLNWVYVSGLVAETIVSWQNVSRHALPAAPSDRSLRPAGQLWERVSNLSSGPLLANVRGKKEIG